MTVHALARRATAAAAVLVAMLLVAPSAAPGPATGPLDLNGGLHHRGTDHRLLPWAGGMQ